MQPKEHTKREPLQLPTEVIAELVIEAGEAMYGKFWKAQLSMAVGYAQTRSSLRRWISGETPISIYVITDLSHLLTQKHEKVSLIIKRLDVQLQEQLTYPVVGHFEKKRNKENLQLLEEVGLLLFGDMWEKALADGIGYSRWGVRAWKIGKRNTPHHLPWLLMRFLELRHQQIENSMRNINSAIDKHREVLMQSPAE